jgi:hypothetical protein
LEVLGSRRQSSDAVSPKLDGRHSFETFFPLAAAIVAMEKRSSGIFPLLRLGRIGWRGGSRLGPPLSSFRRWASILECLSPGSETFAQLSVEGGLLAAQGGEQCSVPVLHQVDRLLALA